MTDPKYHLSPSDLHAIDALRTRMEEFAAAEYGAHVQLDGVCVAYGPLRDRVRELAARVRTVESTANKISDEMAVWDGSVGQIPARIAALGRERDRLRAERTHVRELLDGAGIAADTIPAAVAMLLKERAEWRARMPAAPDVAPGGVEWRGCGLHVNGAYSGEYCEAREGGWWAHRGADTIGPLPNEPTARAVLLALAGQECGTVAFRLRETSTVADLMALQSTDLWHYAGAMVDDLRDGIPIGEQETEDAAIVRAWVAHGQAALTIEAVSDAK